MNTLFLILSVILILCFPATIVASIIVCIVKKKFSLFVISVPINFVALIISLFIVGVTSEPTLESSGNEINKEDNNQSDKEKEQQENQEEQKKEEEEVQEAEKEPENEDEDKKLSFEHNGIEVVYVGYEKYSDEQIFVYFEMTNNSDDKVTFCYSFSVYAYQGGIELETNYIYDCDEEKNGSLEIKPGATIKVAEVFELRNEEDVVEIEIEPFISFTENILFSFEIELNQ